MKYFLYFLIGGTVVSAATYLASHARSLMAAFIANMPVITLITFLAIYHEAGQKAVTSYAVGLVIMLLPWLAYIFSIIFLGQTIGFSSSLVTGLLLYFIIAAAIMSLKSI